MDEIIRWLTGYSQESWKHNWKNRLILRPSCGSSQLNPSRILIKGAVCGVRVEDVQEPTMREIRYLDKLIDELAKGKGMDKILRK